MTEDEIISMILAFHSDRSARGRRELPPPAPAEAVSELEEAVGYPMPPLLKRIYLEVADGRFTTPFRGAYSIKWKDDGPDETRPLLEQYLARARGFDPFYDLDDPYPGFLVPPGTSRLFSLGVRRLEHAGRAHLDK